MATSEIIQKLGKELKNGINTEPQVVYLLAQIRKLIERDNLRAQFEKLNFHCDWVLHSKLDRSSVAKDILKKLDAAYPLLNSGVRLSDLPEPLTSEIKQILKFRFLEEELLKFLEAYRLPPLAEYSSDGWVRFLYLYGKVIEDIPLILSSETEHISHVIVKCEEVRHVEGVEVLFKLTWTSHNKNGQIGDI